MKSWLLACFAIFSLSGCAMFTQNPGGSYSPVNALSTDDSPRLMLQGHDVVAYFTEGKAMAGNKAFASRHAEVDFYFANNTHKQLFDQAPEKYLPQFGGFCANGILYAIPMGGSAEFWRIYDGKLYIFGSAMSIEAFELDRDNNLKLAHTYWNDEIAGRNSFLQRYWRMLWRVPHYRSSATIAEEVAAARAASGSVR